MARLLAEDVNEPRGIACITFNNECVRELEGRLSDLGVESSERVFIGTVHSFSLTQIILPYAKNANLGLPDDFDVATRAECSEALQRALVDAVDNPDARQDWDFRMNNYRRTILNRHSDDWRTTDPELARLTEAYERELRHMGLIDFEDMPLLALKALRENPWLQLAMKAKYPILVVDEYQDLGRALHRMVIGLCFTAGLRLFAVGDPDQSIYGFNGARPDLLRRLATREGVETVHLRLNYRCATSIVVAASSALGEQRDYQAVEGAPEGAVYSHALAGRYEAQATHLINILIPQALARHPHLQLGDVAILYPAAWFGDTLIPAIQEAGLLFIRTDKKALYPRNSRLMQWLELCAQWCCGGWRTGDPLFSQVANAGRRLFTENIRSEEQATDFHRALIATLWGAREDTLPLFEWLTRMQTEFVVRLGQQCASMQDELQTLEIFVEKTSLTGDLHDMTLGQLAGQGTGSNSLNLSSLHSAKGREFSLVFLFGMDNGRLPRTDDSRQQIAEARRLFYVGLTRAKIESHMIYTSGRASPFVNEVRRRLDTGV